MYTYCICHLTITCDVVGLSAFFYDCFYTYSLFNSFTDKVLVSATIGPRWVDWFQISLQTIAKSNKTGQKNGKTKQNHLLSHKWWDSSKMMTDGDDRWWKWWCFRVLEHFFTKANANPNPGKTDHLVASQNSFWRIKAQKHTFLRITWRSSVQAAR